MAEHKQGRTQKTQPKGIDPTTGKPYPPVDIPVPKRGEVDQLFERAMGKKPEKS